MSDSLDARLDEILATIRPDDADSIARAEKVAESAARAALALEIRGR
ncbi:hypothetical protein V6K52_10070 [Knoellia sp. S7-12]